MAVLKKQLDERDKQLATEQEDASAAKNRLREMTKVRHIDHQLPVQDILKYIFIHKNLTSI